VTQPLLEITTRWSEREREREREREQGVHLLLGALGGVQQLLQLGVHGALQLLPHHFLELGHPSVGHAFAET